MILGKFVKSFMSVKCGNYFEIRAVILEHQYLLVVISRFSIKRLPFQSFTTQFSSVVLKKGLVTQIKGQSAAV